VVLAQPAIEAEARDTKPHLLHAVYTGIARKWAGAVRPG
jgi:hypothetical protein